MLKKKEIKFQKQHRAQEIFLISNKERLFHGKCAQMSFITLKKKIDKWVSAVN